jgi:hypothetical protein
MNAQEKVLEYAHKHNANQFDKLTDQELAGKMMIEGVAISRTPNSRVIARIVRDGSQIIITETTRTTVNKIENGRVLDIVTESTIEIDRISL